MNNDKLTDDMIEVSEDTDTKNNNNDFDYSLDFRVIHLILDTPGIDTETVKTISINQTINAVVVEMYNGTTCATIQLEDFSDKTIKPLKQTRLNDSATVLSMYYGQIAGVPNISVGADMRQ